MPGMENHPTRPMRLSDKPNSPSYWDLGRIKKKASTTSAVLFTPVYSPEDGPSSSRLIKAAQIRVRRNAPITTTSTTVFSMPWMDDRPRKPLRPSDELWDESDATALPPRRDRYPLRDQDYDYFIQNKKKGNSHGFPDYNMMQFRSTMFPTTEEEQTYTRFPDYAPPRHRMGPRLNDPSDPPPYSPTPWYTTHGGLRDRPPNRRFWLETEEYDDSGELSRKGRRRGYSDDEVMRFRSTMFPTTEEEQTYTRFPDYAPPRYRLIERILEQENGQAERSSDHDSLRKRRPVNRDPPTRDPPTTRREYFTPDFPGRNRRPSGRLESELDKNDPYYDYFIKIARDQRRPPRRGPTEGNEDHWTEKARRDAPPTGATTRRPYSMPHFPDAPPGRFHSNARLYY